MFWNTYYEGTYLPCSETIWILAKPTFKCKAFDSNRKISTFVWKENDRLETLHPDTSIIGVN